MKPLPILTIAALLCFNSSAQEFVWAKQFSGEQTMHGNAITTDSDGNVIGAGRFEGRADFDPGPDTLYHEAEHPGSFNAFITKLNSNGDLEWSIQFDADIHRCDILSINADSQNDLIVVGYFGGTVDFDPGPGELLITETGDEWSFIAKVSSEGELVWVRILESEANVFIRAMVLDESDNILVGGTYNHETDFDPDTSQYILTPSSGWYQAFYAKYDAQGGLIWVKGIESSGDGSTFGIDVDLNGKIIVVGSYGGVTDFNPGGANGTPPSSGGYELFVLSAASSGNFNWVKSIDTNSQGASPTTVKCDSDGNIMVYGDFYHTVDFDPGLGVGELTGGGSSTSYLLKLNSSGDFRWVKHVDYGEDWAESNLALFHDEIYMVAKYDQDDMIYDGVNLPVTDFNSSDNGCILKIDTSGSLVWFLEYGGSGHQYTRSIAIDESGAIYSFGKFEDELICPSPNQMFELESEGHHDVFIHKIVESSELDVAAIEVSLDLKIYPNPATEKVFLTMDNGQIESVDVFDQSGRLLISEAGKSTVDVSGLNAGIYVLRVETGDSSSHQRLIIR